MTYCDHMVNLQTTVFISKPDLYSFGVHAKKYRCISVEPLFFPGSGISASDADFTII